ncbi:unnamed protein product [Symbiodinium natans]|uniref:Uncharacterized protein n=1 Tax=Symbiodinium natans TaxID=878477 RepID=A0A812TXT9_9DINO|nr:unnamed protein product [Symbiodinium natans]
MRDTAEKCTLRIPQSRPQQLSTIAQSPTSLSPSSSLSMQATTQQALRQLSELSPQALANSARNSAICSFNGEASTGATGKRSATRLSELEAQGPANLVRGSTASLTAEGSLSASLPCAVAPRLTQLSTQNLANTAWDPAVPDKAQKPLLALASSTALRRLTWMDHLHPPDRSELVARCTFILSVAWAMAFTDLLEDEASRRQHATGVTFSILTAFAISQSQQ